MAQRFRIRGRPLSWVAWLIPPAAALPAVVGLFRLYGRHADGWIWIAVGGGLLLVSVVALTVMVRRRQWLIDHGDGFEIRDSAGSRCYGDAQVASVGYSARQELLPGGETAVRPTLRLRIDSPFGGESLDAAFRTPVADGPAVGRLAKRLCAAVAAAADKKSEAGGELHGDGWSLRRDWLAIGPEGAAKDWPVDALAAVDICDDQLCVWIAGRAAPVLRTPTASLNAWALELLLAERLSRLPTDPDTAKTPPVRGLGRLLFEQCTGHGPLPEVAFSASLALVSGIFLLSLLSIPNQDGGGVANGIAVLMLAGVAVAIGIVVLMLAPAYLFTVPPRMTRRSRGRPGGL